MKNSAFLRRLAAWFRRDRLDDEMRDEVALHIELRRQQLIADGMDPRAADSAAKRMFGNVTAIREEARALWGMAVFDRLAQDLRYGLRVMAKSRGFSAVAILSLAVGIGASTVLFSFANAFVFRPLNAASPSGLLQVFTSSSRGTRHGGSSYPDYQDFRHRTSVFSGLMASTRVSATLSDAERADLIEGVLVSDGYFEVLGLRPSRGRFFLPEENRTPLAHPVVVLSYDAWVRRFGSDPEIVGRIIELNGHAFTVVGVGPTKFSGTSFDAAADFFAPIMMQQAITPGPDLTRNRRARAFTVYGRLRDGVTRAQADAALGVLAAQLFLHEPAAWTDQNGRSRVVTILPELAARMAGTGPGAVAALLSSMMAAVAGLLTIACVNVATVLLGRAAARRKEIAVRLALGASRRRVVQQLLTECGLLAAAGGTLGLLLAQWVAALFVRFRPDEAPAFDLSVDYRVFLFTVSASAVAVLLFGLAPALQTTRTDVNAELKESSPVLRVRRWRIGLRDALVVVQVALSVAFLIGGSLLYRSVRAGQTEDPGFRREGVLNVGINLSTIATSQEAYARFYRDAVRAVSALPGIDRVAVASLVPLDGSNRGMKLDFSDSGSTFSAWPDVNVVGAGYFALMDIPLLRGRECDSSDHPGAPRVAVVNESFAQHLGKNQAVGRIFKDADDDTRFQIVGIVRDLRHRSFAEKPLAMVYFCADQQYDARMTLHLRTAAPSAAVGAEVLRTLHDINRAAALTAAETMTAYIDRVTMPQRLGGLAAAATAFLELALAVMALYGVIVYATSRRTREIGVRMALGATVGSVTRLVMRDGLVLGALGVCLGAVLALATGPLLASLLIGIGPTDPVSFGGAAVLLLIVAAVASYLPARRAARVDPVQALRSE
jgi:macrolide transport system ATP-binding/permease protein